MHEIPLAATLMFSRETVRHWWNLSAFFTFFFTRDVQTVGISAGSIVISYLIRVCSFSRFDKVLMIFYKALLVTVLTRSVLSKQLLIKSYGPTRWLGQSVQPTKQQLRCGKNKSHLMNPSCCEGIVCLVVDWWIYPALGRGGRCYSSISTYISSSTPDSCDSVFTYYTALLLSLPFSQSTSVPYSSIFLKRALFSFTSQASKRITWFLC